MYSSSFQCTISISLWITHFHGEHILVCNIDIASILTNTYIHIYTRIYICNFRKLSVDLWKSYFYGILVMKWFCLPSYLLCVCVWVFIHNFLCRISRFRKTIFCLRLYLSTHTSLLLYPHICMCLVCQLKVKLFMFHFISWNYALTCNCNVEQ